LTQEEAGRDEGRENGEGKRNSGRVNEGKRPFLELGDTSSQKPQSGAALKAVRGNSPVKKRE